MVVETLAVGVGLLVKQIVIKSVVDYASEKLSNRVLGSKEQRALRSSLNKALQKFQENHKEVYDSLLKKDSFWEHFKDQYVRFLDPRSNPNINELTDQIFHLTTVPKNKISNSLEDLFSLIKLEMEKQPDLKTNATLREVIQITENQSEIMDRLGIDSLDKLDKKVKIASSEYLQNWVKKFPQLLTAVPLTLGNQNTENVEAYHYVTLVELLANQNKVIIEANPGAGKTTALFQIAHEILKINEAIYPLFISLPNWSDRGSFFEDVAKADAFSQQNITPHNLQSLARHGHLVLILDGWNELSEEKRKLAEIEISKLEIDYPNLAVLVSTRKTTLPPQMKFNVEFTIIPLRRDERNQIIEFSLRGQSPNVLIKKLDENPSLREIASIPFYLNVLISVFKNTGNLPATKEEVIHAFVKALPRRAELRDFTYDGAEAEYLADLSLKIMENGGVSLSTADARIAINETSAKIFARGEIATSPSTTYVLDALTKDNLLIYDAQSDGWSFQHQQFLEWYASKWVEEIIKNAPIPESNEQNLLYQKVLNIPRWEESLYFALERMSSDPQNDAAIAFAVRAALIVDPMLAADITRFTNAVVWEEIRDEVIPYANRWYQSGKIRQVWSFVIATGKKEFAEIFWSLIGEEEGKNNLHIMMAKHPVKMSLLGNNPEEAIKKLSESRRTELLSDLVDGGDAEIEFAVSSALADVSLFVKKRVFEYLCFNGNEEQIIRMLKDLNLELYEIYLDHQEAREVEPNQLLTQVIDYLTQASMAMPSTLGRLRLQLKLREFGVKSLDDYISGSIATVEDDKDPWRRLDLYKQIRAFLPELVNNIIIEKIIRHERLPAQAETLIADANLEQRARLRESLREPILGRDPVGPQLLSVDDIIILLQDLFTLATSVPREERIPIAISKKMRAIEDILRTVDIENFITAILFIEKQANAFTWKSFKKGISDLVRPSGKAEEKKRNIIFVPKFSGLGLSGEEIAAVTESFAWPEFGASEEAQKLRIGIDLQKEEKFRKVLKSWVHILRENPNQYGYRNEFAEIAMIFGRLGYASDVKTITDLLDYDESYCAKLRADWEATGRRATRPDALGMSYSTQYHRSLQNMPARDAVAGVQKYLLGGSFYLEAALVIRNAWFVDSGFAGGKEKISSSPDFSGVRKKASDLARMSRSEPHEFIKPVLNQIELLLPNCKDIATRRKVFALARAIADTDYGTGFSLLFSVVTLEGHEEKYPLLMKMIQQGERIPLEIILQECEKAMHEWENPEHFARDDWYKVEKWLELLAFTDDPSAVIPFLLRVPENRRYDRTFDRVLISLMHSTSTYAEMAVISLAKEFPFLKNHYYWLKALYPHISPQGQEFVYKEVFWDPKTAKDTYSFGEVLERLVEIIVDTIKSNEEIRADFINRMHLADANTRTTRVGRVVAKLLDDQELVKSSLLRFQNEVAYRRDVGELVTGQETIPGKGGAYRIVPRNSAYIRETLLKMTRDDPARNIIAGQLLEDIDLIRGESGRNEDEPRHPCLESGISWPILS